MGIKSLLCAKSMPETDGTEKEQQCRFCVTPTLLLRSFTMFTRFSLFFASAVLFLIYLDIQRTNGNNVMEAVPYVGEQSTSVKCLQPTVDLSKMLQNAPVVLAGRFRQRFGKTNAKLNSDRFSLPDQRFNATVLVTNVYKSFDHKQDQIMVGSFFTPTVDSHDGPGCLDAFYRNSKYIFFLRRNMNADNFYDVTYNPHPYTDELDQNIQAKQCVNCFAPKIQPLDDLLLKPGSKLTVTCSASGKPSPELVWVKNGKSLNLVDKSVSIEMIKVSEDNVESVLEISNLIRIDSGEYKCLATNPLGKASELFNLQITQPEKSGQLLMDTELVPCSDEDRDYCLNGGQCYMLKSDRNVLQCSCHTPFYGAQCERTAVDQSEYQPYAEVADPDMEHMLKHVLSEVITPLMWSVWIGFPVTILLLVYLITKGRGDQCQKNVQKKRNREPRNKGRNSFAPLVPGQSQTQNNLSETDISLAHGGFGNHHLDVPHNNRRYCLTHLSGSTQKRHHPLTKSQPQPIKPTESESILVQHTPLCFQKPTYNQRGIFQRNFYEATTADLTFPQSTEASHVFAHVVTGGPVQANDFPATLQKTMNPAHVHASYMQAMCEPINSHVQ